MQLVMLLLLLSCFGNFVMSSACNVDEVTVRKISNGTITECYHCPNCPSGLGLAVLCGSTITNLTSLECVRCQKGINYSDKHDYSMCQSCQHCDPNQEKTGECTAEKDETICGKCHNGYYEEITGGKCEECSWCCKDNENQRRMSECIQANLPVNRQCAKSSLADSCAPKEPNKQELPVGIIVSVFVCAVIVLLVIVFACPRTRRKLRKIGQRIRTRSPGTSVESESEANTLGPACPSQNGSRKMHQLSATSLLKQFSNRSYDKFDNEGEGENSSKSASNGNCNINRNSGDGPVMSDFNPDLLSSKNDENKIKANPSDSACPSPNESGNIHSLPLRYDRGYSQPGCEDENPSKNGSQISGENYYSPNGNCTVNRNLCGGPVGSDFNPELLSANCAEIEIKAKTSGPACPLPSGSGNKCKYSTVPLYERRYSHPGSDQRDDQPVAPSSFPSHGRDRNISKHEQEVNNVLLELKRSREFPENQLNKKASEIPYTVLKDLCPVMNIIRESSYDDFRMMGEYMGFEQTIIKAAGSDPTKRLLELYGSKFGGTVGHVMAIFIVMKRDDAFSVLKTYCLEQGSS